MKKFLENIYVICFVSALILHVFNSFGVSETIKLFHIPAAMAFVLSFFLCDTKSKLTKLVYVFTIWILFGALFSSWDGSIFHGLTVFIIIISGLGISNSNSLKVLHLLNICIPIPVFALLALYFTDTWFRFQGFYEDPNYLCTTLMFFIFIIFVEFSTIRNILVKYALLVEMLLILFLVSTTVSRTGLICNSLVILSFFFEKFSKNKLKSVLVLISLLFGVYYTNADRVEQSIDSYVYREARSDNLKGASSLRTEISLRGVNYILDNPKYLLQGMGSGSTGHAEVFENLVAKTFHRDHNTYTSVFSEYGIVGLILFFKIFLLLFMRIRCANINKYQRYFYLASFCALLLFGLSIYQISYLPFWYMIFFIFYLSNISKKHV